MPCMWDKDSLKGAKDFIIFMHPRPVISIPSEWGETGQNGEKKMCVQI